MIAIRLSDAPIYICIDCRKDVDSEEPCDPVEGKRYLHERVRQESDLRTSKACKTAPGSASTSPS